MKTLGIIAEFNPFHKGHEYFINQAKEITGCDRVIVVMSGDYVQRGMPAIISKEKRAKCALLNGADMVFELPTYYSLSSAQYFARGAVNILDKLGVIDCIAFGSECADMSLLQKVSDIILGDSTEYNEIIMKELTCGKSFPAARMAAINTSVGKTPASLDEITNALMSPNNILGIEYLCALNHFKSKMKPYTIKRIGQGYNDEDRALSDDNSFSSASSIRKQLNEFSSKSSVFRDVPENTLEYLIGDAQFKAYISSSQKSFCDKEIPISYPGIDDFSEILAQKLYFEKDFSIYADVSSDLSDKIIKYSDIFETITDFADILKSKDMTYSRIIRSLIHIVLNMTNEEMKKIKEENYPVYLRPLGFRRNSADLFTKIKEKASLPLVSKLADSGNILDEKALFLLNADIAASRLYGTINKNDPRINEYAKSLQII